MTTSKCIFTICFGNHDFLREPVIKSKGWDYICFTDNKDLKSDVWNIRLIDSNLEPKYTARYVYINSHLFTKKYSYSLMWGTQIRQIGDINNFIKCFNLKADFNLMRHPCRTSIYKEAEIIIKEKIDFSENVNPQMERYRSEGFPDNFGLSACGIIGRWNNEKTKRFNEQWWEELKKGSYRDQLSFDYVRWKNPDILFSWFGYDEALHGEYFELYKHNTNIKI